MELFGLSGFMGVFAASGIGLIVVILIMAIGQKLATMRDVRALKRVQLSPSASLDSEVEVERARFGLTVRRYEEALANKVRQEAAVSGIGSVSVSAEEQPEGLAHLESVKEMARQRLVDAQSRLDLARPTNGSSSKLDLWFGSGILRGWQIGPIGYETIVLRIDHVTNEDAWSLWRIGRFRLGMAIGVEKQKLSIFLFGASQDSVSELLSRGFGGAEVGIRPGLALARTWRRLRRKPVARESVRQTLKAANHKGLKRPPSQKCRTRVVEAYEYELGVPLATLAELPGSEAMLAIQTSGPSLLAGAWSGREPTAKLIKGSPDGAWVNPN